VCSLLFRSNAFGTGDVPPSRDFSAGHDRFLIVDHQTDSFPVDALGDVALFCVATPSFHALFVAPATAE